ncbi:methyltransferase domain-containing protein [Candidatus Thorarchaeota archaeon]|nr:MAG: methyltransferase domain-containing protein [Candidatus Thorarchaeota archaeon]
MYSNGIVEGIVHHDFLFQGVHWLIEVLILILLFMFLWVCCCVRSIRYFWKFPMPAAMGNVIAAGPYRKRVQPPSMVVDAIDAKPGMTVIDIGCGSGLYTVAVAEAVQPDGVVYAVDIQEGMLERLKDRMEREGIKNIIPVLADAEGQIPLEEGIADAIFSTAVIPEIPDPVMALLQVKRLLRVGGLFAEAELLLDPDFPLASTVKKWARKAGLVFEKQVGHAFRYVLVFRKDS